MSAPSTFDTAARRDTCPRCERGGLWWRERRLVCGHRPCGFEVENPSRLWLAVDGDRHAHHVHTAAHEAGHALLAMIVRPDVVDFVHISYNRRKGRLGHLVSKPLASPEESWLPILVAGDAAEQLAFGAPDVGESKDLTKALALAKGDALAIERARALARETLDRRWGVFERIVDALLAKSIVSWSRRAREPRFHWPRVTAARLRELIGVPPPEQLALFAAREERA